MQSANQNALWLPHCNVNRHHKLFLHSIYFSYHISQLKHWNDNTFRQHPYSVWLQGQHHGDTMVTTDVTLSLLCGRGFWRWMMVALSFPVTHPTPIPHPRPNFSPPLPVPSLECKLLRQNDGLVLLVGGLHASAIFLAEYCQWQDPAVCIAISLPSHLIFPHHHREQSISRRRLHAQKQAKANGCVQSWAQLFCAAFTAWRKPVFLGMALPLIARPWRAGCVACRCRAGWQSDGCVCLCVWCLFKATATKKRQPS